MKTCLEHLWNISLSSYSAGPCGGEQPKKKYLWCDYGACTTFATTAQLENWFNERLEIDTALIDRGCYDLPNVPATPDPIQVDRNILVLADNTLCLLDWGYSGKHPHMFELHSIRACESHSPEPMKPLLNLLDDALSLLYKRSGLTVARVCQRQRSSGSGECNGLGFVYSKAKSHMSAVPLR